MSGASHGRDKYVISRWEFGLDSGFRGLSEVEDGLELFRYLSLVTRSSTGWGRRRLVGVSAGIDILRDRSTSWRRVE
jgi:hypothetical protein